jgi:hypothetical protein
LDEVTADNCYIYTYKIPVEKFKEIKNIMFSDQNLGYIHSLGIKADLNGADFIIDGDEGKLSTIQALEIANIINVTSNWSLIGENIDIPDYQKSISIRFREDDKVCEFKFIDSDNYLIINESSLKGEHIRTRLYQSDFDRYLTLKVLFNNGMECDFSPELGDADHAYITVVKDGTVTGRQVSREKLDALLHDNVNMKWYAIYNPPTPSDYNAAVFINIGNKIISFYKMGDYAYCFDYVDDCFRFEGFDYLTKWALDLPEPAKDATEYVHQWLNEVLSNKEIHISSFNNMKNNSATYYTIEDTERLKQIFSEFDWECISSVKHIPYLSSAFLPDESYYSSGITVTENEKIMYFIDNGLGTIPIRSNGTISSSYTGCTYQCSDPDEMLKAIDELLKDSPKKIY